MQDLDFDRWLREFDGLVEKPVGDSVLSGQLYIENMSLHSNSSPAKDKAVSDADLEAIASKIASCL